MNLDEATFIDKSGDRMLRCMSNQVAQLAAGHVCVKQVLDRLRGESNELEPASHLGSGTRELSCTAKTPYRSNRWSRFSKL